MSTNIAVIGAGISGLSAAWHLQNAGFDKVSVYESSDRLGGRILTNRDFAEDVTVEEGASFNHELDSALGNRIVDLRIPTVKWPKLQEMLFRTAGNELLNYREARDRDPELEKARAWKFKKTPVKQGESLETYLRRAGYNDREIAFVERGFGNACGLDLKQLDAKQYLREVFAYATTDRLVEGFDVVINDLAKDLDIRTNKQVANINWEDKQQAKIKFTDGRQETADAVVVTVPLSVLKQDGFITPGFNKRRSAALDCGVMSPNGKLIYAFNEPIFEKGRFSPEPLALSSDGSPPTWWTATYGKQTGPQVWCGFFGAHWGAELLAMKPEQALARGLETLRRETGIHNLEPINQKITNWHNEISRGAYSVWLPGGADAPNIISEPMHPIYFAGEHTRRSYRKPGKQRRRTSTTHSAYDSGERVAQEIMQRFFGRNSLLTADF